MNDTRIDSIATARGLVRQARDRARNSARRHPDSTWIDTYTAIDRTQAHIGLAEPSGDVPVQAVTGVVAGQFAGAVIPVADTF